MHVATLEGSIAEKIHLVHVVVVYITFLLPTKSMSASHIEQILL